MKTFRKALSIILGAAIMLSCLFGMQVSVAAEGTVAVSVGEATVADGVVTVPVVATGSLQAFTVTVDYDNTVLTLADAEKVALPDVEDSAVFGPTDAETFKMMWAFALEEADVVLDNTQIATLTFNVVDEAAEATDITLTVTEAWDVAGNEVAATAGVNTVTLKTEPAEPVLDETIAPSTHTVAIGETFGIGFRFDLSTISEDYASFRIDIHRTTFASGFNFAYEDVSYTTFSKNTKQNFMACTTTYYGTQLFSLTAPVEYTLHCFDAEGTEVAYSRTFTTTLADIAVAYHDLSTTSAPMKRVMADLIQVGAAALNHFTKNRTQACDYSTLPVPTIDSEYITTELGALASHSSSEGVPLTITGALQASPYFNMRFSENVANKAQYEFKISFYQALGKKDVTYTVGPDAMNGNATTISTKLETFPIFATNADVTFELYKDGVVVGTTHYCLEKYIADTMAATSSATLKTLLQEVGEMAQSIRTARNI